MYVNPNIEQSENPIQLLLPRRSFLLEHLQTNTHVMIDILQKQSVDLTDFVVRAELHGSDSIDMIFYFGEQIVPTSNESTLVLIVDHVQFIGLPLLSHLYKKQCTVRKATSLASNMKLSSNQRFISDHVTRLV